MNDKQQLSAMGEHMREAVECEPRVTQDARIGGVVFKAGVKVSTVIEAAYRAAEYHNEHHKPNPESIKTIIDAVRNYASDFKVPDGWRLVPASPTAEMLKAAADMPLKATRGMHDSACYRVMLDAAPEYKP